jgi:hypothetical protein
MKRAAKHVPQRDIVVWGFDTETWDGPPISLQFHSDQQPQSTRIYQVKEKTATKTFFRHLDKFCDPDKHYRVYGHYLEFDLLSAMWDIRHELIGNHGVFEFTFGDWSIEGCYGRPTFARLTTGLGHLVEVVDSALWFRGSLDSAANLYCPDLPKLPRPAALGEQWFSVGDSSFAAYAMRDAEIAARLGKLVEDFHTSLELRPSISLASQAAQVFRQRYIEDPIHQCPTEFIEPSIAAYHGGKNNLVRGAAPVWHEDAAMYDISSAYPWAMTELPTFTKPDHYSTASLPPSVKRVPVPGVYKVTGNIAPCDWPIFFSHDFKPLRACKVEDLWVHGYELNEALRAGEFKPTARITGCYYRSETRGEAATARFCRDFYKLKSTAPNDTDRYMYKILLNCISGKFIQTREQDVLLAGGEVSREHVAGGLFHPFIAGAITAHTRAAMHRVEHAYRAHHTATDGIIADERKRLPSPASLEMPASGLGALNHEMSGNVALLRTKLYIGYSKSPKGLESRVFKEPWRIHKYALHGFQGRVGDLEEMILSNRRWYHAPHRIGLREAVKHGTTPNRFIQRELKLMVGAMQNG